MSNLPPHLDPDQKYSFPPPPPPMPSYAMAPVPVLPMPMYPQPSDGSRPGPSQPTFITNYFLPPPEPVEAVEHTPIRIPEVIEWLPATSYNVDAFTYRSVVAGREPGEGGSPLWVIRAHHGGDLLPGKLSLFERKAYVPFDRKEVLLERFQVLCAPKTGIRWIACRKGMVPPGAIPGGSTAAGEVLYIGRVAHKGSITPGKIHPSHRRLYISFGGKEIAYKDYEVLCKVKE